MYQEVINIIWALGGSIALLFETVKSGADDNYFQKLIRDNVKLVVVVEFLANAYTFSLVSKLVTLPIIAFVAAMAAYSEFDEKYTAVRKLMNVLLVLYGGVVVFYSGYEAIVNLSSFLAADNLRGLLLPPILSVAVVPYLYLVALYVQYENVFVRLKCLDNDKDVTQFAKRMIMARFRLDLKALKNWSKGRRLRFCSKDEVILSLQE